MTAIVVENLRRQLGQTLAIDSVSLEIESGELFFLLGPSGCGKSTLLGLIAGLDQPDTGRILFDQRDVTGVPTEKRNAVMCFQSYALFPHLTVQANIAFGLEVRRLETARIRERVSEILQLVQLQEVAQRKPGELSGGQQQRVALGRALAVDPACLLLDEPLSNLDARLRQEMRTEIRRLCKASKLTTIYVTHDQKEALSIADRIAVMNRGRIVQVGSPADLYLRPGSAFVAEFIASANLLRGRVLTRSAGALEVVTELGSLSVCTEQSPKAETLTLSLRPDQICFGEHAEFPELNSFQATAQDSGFLGESSEHVFEVGKTRLRATRSPPEFSLPKTLTIHLPPESLLVHSDLD
ncbi:MAG TPA: ABC transporter ATP-binding protein [Polyangiaceae bacterium]|nr:ABC transporter ATP-binding protein [Polyangiaceae bacterium]